MLKRIGKAVAVAFSMYSRIPMPGFVWESADMEYHLCFFPWIGAVIGALEWGLFRLADSLSLGELPRTSLALAIPLLVTGGFHVDGFMDTSDARHSYQSRERKLEILKDPHIGAFSVITLLTYLLLAAAVISMLTGEKAAAVCCFAFFIARCLSGISVLTFPKAKKDGMLQTEGMTAAKKKVLAALFSQLLIAAAGMAILDPVYAAAALLAAGGSFAYYHCMSRKEFGGITGDLAGYFVCICELFMAAAVVAADVVFGGGL